MRRLVIVFGVLLLAGCTLAPKYERTPGEVPQEYRFQNLQGQPQAELNNLADLAWWEIFDDRELQGLIRTALTQNYDVLLAAARVAEARALVGVSRSLWLPQAGGTYLFQRQRISQVSFPPLTPGAPHTGNISQLNLDLFWEIDLFGRLRSLTEAARAEFFASEWARRAVYSTVVADVAQAYFELRTLDQQLEISQATLKSYEASRRLVVMRFERGMVSRQDVAQVVALVHTAGAKIPDLRRQIAQKENQICILLGINPKPITRGRALPDLVVRATVPAGLPSNLLERRPDIRQAEEVLVAANYRIGAARADFFPRISLTSLFGRQSLDLSDLFTGPAKIWSIGPTVTLPVFTSGRNYFNLQATKALEEQTLVLYQFTVRQAFREVADGLIAHTEFREFRKEQEALVKSYLDYSQLANLRYKGGLESYLAVLDADRQLFTAQLDLAAVQRDQLLTLVQLYKALGGGWETQDRPPRAATPASGSVNHPGQ
jgi:multidrug efflux system outer membrane protein